MVNNSWSKLPQGQNSPPVPDHWEDGNYIHAKDDSPGLVGKMYGAF